MDSSESNVTWIREFLVPKLVEDGKFGAGVLVKSVEITRLSMAEAFMLTICHKIKLTVTDDKLSNERTYGIVVKVKRIQLSNKPIYVIHKSYKKND